MFVTRRRAELRLIHEFDYLKRRSLDIQTRFITTCGDIVHYTETSAAMNRHFGEATERPTSVWDSPEGKMLLLSNPILESAGTPRAQLVPMITFIGNQRKTPPLSAVIKLNCSVPEPISLVDVHTVPEMICVAGDACLRLFSKNSGTCMVDWVTQVCGTQCMVRSIGLAAGRVMFGSDDGVVRVYDIAYAAVIEEWPAHKDPVILVRTLASDEKKYIITASVTGDVCLWDAETIEEEARISVDDAVVEATFENGNFVLVTRNKKTIFWSLSTGITRRNTPCVTRFDSAPFKIDICGNVIRVTSRAFLGQSIELSLNQEPIESVDWIDSFIIAAAGTKFAIWQVFYMEEQQ